MKILGKPGVFLRHFHTNQPRPDMSSNALVPHSSEANAVVANEAQRLTRLRLLFDGLQTDDKQVEELACRQVGRIFLIGNLLEAQKQASRGSFTDWCAENISQHNMRTLQRWMQVAHAAQKANNQLGDVARTLLLDGINEPDEIEKLGASVKTVSGAGSVNQLYQWAVTIQHPKPVKRERPVKKLTTEERLEQRKGEVRRNWQHLETAHRGYGIQFTLKDDLEVQAETALLDAQSAVRKAWLKTPAKKRDPRALEKMLERLLNASAKD